ncbi:hypothetical protein D3C84_921930 [compost metagenome]
MAQEHQRLDAIGRLSAALTGFQRQKQRAGCQQGGQEQVGAMFEAFGKFQWIDHGIKGSSAHWVKADKPLHRDFPASGVFHVVKPVRFKGAVLRVL